MTEPQQHSQQPKELSFVEMKELIDELRPKIDEKDRLRNELRSKTVKVLKSVWGKLVRSLLIKLGLDHLISTDTSETASQETQSPPEQDAVSFPQGNKRRKLSKRKNKFIISLKKEEFIDDIVEIYFGNEPVTVRRLSEQKAMEELENADPTNCTISFGNVQVPSEVIEEILSYMKYESSLLYTVGSVNEKLFSLCMKTWKGKIRVSTKNVKEIPLFILKFNTQLKVHFVANDLNQKTVNYFFKQLSCVSSIIEVEISGGSQEQPRKTEIRNLVNTIGYLHKALTTKKKKKKDSEKKKIFANVKTLKLPWRVALGKKYVPHEEFDKLSLSRLFPNTSYLFYPFDNFTFGEGKSDQSKYNKNGLRSWNRNFSKLSKLEISLLPWDRAISNIVGHEVVCNIRELVIEFVPYGWMHIREGGFDWEKLLGSMILLEKLSMIVKVEKDDLNKETEMWKDEKFNFVSLKRLTVLQFEIDLYAFPLRSSSDLDFRCDLKFFEDGKRLKKVIFSNVPLSSVDQALKTCLSSLKELKISYKRNKCCDSCWKELIPNEKNEPHFHDTLSQLLFIPKKSNLLIESTTSGERIRICSDKKWKEIGILILKVPNKHMTARLDQRQDNLFDLNVIPTIKKYLNSVFCGETISTYRYDSIEIVENTDADMDVGKDQKLCSPPENCWCLISRTPKWKKLHDVLYDKKGEIRGCWIRHFSYVCKRRYEKVEDIEIL